MVKTMTKAKKIKNLQSKERRNCRDSFYDAGEKIYDRSEMFRDKTKKKGEQHKKYLKYAAMYLGAFVLGMLVRFLIGVCAQL